jgi:phage gpG-like protein
MRARIMHETAKLAEYHVKEVNFPAEAFVDRPIKRWKRTKKTGKTLVKTGHMKRSIQILKITKSLAWVGTSVQYAIKHQLGRGFPVRQFIGHSAVLATATRRLITSKLNKAARAPF